MTDKARPRNPSSGEQWRELLVQSGEWAAFVVLAACGALFTAAMRLRGAVRRDHRSASSRSASDTSRGIRRCRA